MPSDNRFLDRIANRVLRIQVVRKAVEEEFSRRFPHWSETQDFDENDVFIVGFPKSGNTWLGQLIAGLMLGASPRLFPDKLVQEIVPDVHAKAYYKRFFDRCFFKSHELPNKKYRKVIYLVRDGRDVMVSYWKYHNALNATKIDFYDIVDEPVAQFGYWEDHVRSWLENPFDADCLLLRYEDLKDDSVAELRNICDFLELERSQLTLQQVGDGASFANMRAKEEESGWENTKWPSNARFVRRGCVGGYVDEISAELQDHLLMRQERMLRKLGYIKE